MKKSLAQRKLLAHRAMPAVRALVKKYGRQAVAQCLTKLRDHEKKIKQLEQAKREVAALERSIKQ